MEICRRTALKKKWRVPVRGKYDAFTFIFASILSLFMKKKKRKKERDRGRNGGENKMANVLIRAVGEAKLFSDTLTPLCRLILGDVSPKIMSRTSIWITVGDARTTRLSTNWLAFFNGILRQVQLQKATPSLVER